MERARSMGFDVDTPLYHGTAVDIPAFDASKRGGVTNARSAKLGTWLTESPETARGYADLASGKPVADLIKKSEAAERAGQWDKAHDYMAQAEKLEASGGAGGQNILPLYVRGKMKTVDMDGVRYDPDDHDLSGMVRAAKAEGFDGVRFENFSDEAEWGVHRPTTHVVVFDPANIRGKFAKFDPSQEQSSKLLAGMSGNAQAIGALGGTGLGFATAPDQNGDGVVDAQERMLGGAGGALTGGIAGRGVRGGMNALAPKPVAPKPVATAAPAKLGLGAPPSAKPDVAALKQQGFNTDKVYYHGSDKEFDTFDMSRAGSREIPWYGRGAYLTPDSRMAKNYANGGKVMPFYVRGKMLEIRKPEDWPSWLNKEADIPQQLKDRGYVGLDIDIKTQGPQYDKNFRPIVNAQGKLVTKEESMPEVVVFDPANIVRVPR